jgi:hypothetical protein
VFTIVIIAIIIIIIIRNIRTQEKSRNTANPVAGFGSP